jgi:diacylglycerol O-acyltransferase
VQKGLQVLVCDRGSAYGAIVALSTRPSALEASFLALERPGLPMHVAGVIVLEPDPDRGAITMGELRRHVRSRLSKLPRYQQRVELGWLGGRPRWVDAGPLDLSHHLFRHELPPHAGRRELARFCADLHAESLPADRPLWQMHLVDGPRGAQALVMKTHHSITDGVGGMHIAETLFDRGRLSPRPLSSEQGLGFVRPPTSRGLAAGQALLGAAFTAAGGPIAIPSRFNVQVGADRAAAFATIPMRAIAGLKRRFGASVDDVLLALVASALARTGPEGSQRPLRAMLPVSTWTPGRGEGSGNHVATVFVDLPQDTRDLGELVARIAASKAILRTAHAAAGTAMMVEAAGLLPPLLHRAVVRIAASLQVANLVVSDVPGPQEPLSLLGRRIVACYPMIPLPPSIGLSIAAVTMGGAMGVGIVSDPRAMARPQRLADEVERLVRTPATRAGRPAAAHAQVRPRAA